MRGQREPQHKRDADGAEIVVVALPDGKSAKLLTKDFQRLMAAGLTSQWFLNSSGNGYAYVRCQLAGRNNVISVARLICEPPPNQSINYIDGDRTNLRRENLHVRSGKRPSGRRAVQFGSSSVATNAAG